MISTCNIIHSTAMTLIGERVASDVNKPYITNGITQVITDLRNKKKGTINKLLKRIRNMKINTNSTVTHRQIKLDIINHFGLIAYNKCQNWIMRNKNKMKLIRAAKREYQNRKIRKLAKKHKYRMHYKVIDQITKTGYNKNDQIPNIIKPNIAINESDIKYIQFHPSHYTHNSYETASEINKYFNTIGNNINPNYKNTLQTN